MELQLYLSSVKNANLDLPRLETRAIGRKHIVGHERYEPGRSMLTSDAQSLLDDFHTGNINSSRVINETKTSVDFGKPIGYFVKDNISEPTSIGTVINSKTGVHIVPANPIQY